MPEQPTVELTRHFHAVSERESDAMAESVVDMIMSFLTANYEPNQTTADQASLRHIRRPGKASSKAVRT